MRSAARLAGIATLALQCGVCLVLAFRHGAYTPVYWLSLLVGMAALALVLVLTAPGAGAGRLQIALVAVFGAQAVWTALSLLWAASPFNAWQELNRTLLFALGLVLTFVAVRWVGRRGLEWLALLLTAFVAAVGLTIIVRLATTGDPAALFVGGRLNYPVTYWNALGTLLMLGFWLALGLANAGYGQRLCRRLREKVVPAAGPGAGAPADAPADAHPATGDPAAPQPRRQDRHKPKSRAAAFDRRYVWVTPVLLAVAVMLLELALLPQSRGALWACLLVVPFFVLLSPHRFRALLHLAFVALPVVLFWGRFDGVYSALRAKPPDAGAVDEALSLALTAVGLSVLIVLALWLVSWALERWIGPLSRRVTLAVAAALVVVVLVVGVAGLVVADRHTGGLGGYLGDRWTEFTSDKGPDREAGSRFSDVGLNGRITQWKVAGQAFAERPLLGLGAQNYEAYYFEHRTTRLEVRQPHSQPMQVLAELGLPGFLLWVGLIVAVFVRAAVLRFRTADRAAAAAWGAVMTAMLVWFIHSSADWIWQLAGASLPAMMLVGGLIAADRVPKREKVPRAATTIEPTTPESATPELPTPEPTTPESPRQASPAAWRQWLLRGVGAVVCVAVLVSGALPYLSLRYTDAAAGAGVADLEHGLAQAATAERFDPTSPQPFMTRAFLHETAARAGAPGSAVQSEHYAQAAGEWQAGIAKEPSNWLLYFQAARLDVEWSQTLIDHDPALARMLLGRAGEYLDEVDVRNPLSRQSDKLREMIDLTMNVDSE